MTLELTEQEVAALLLLLKLGMDCYTLAPADDAVMEALARIPDAVLDRIVVKVAKLGAAVG